MSHLVDDTHVEFIKHEREDTRLIVFHTHFIIAIDIAVLHMNHYRRGHVYLSALTGHCLCSGRDAERGDGHQMVVMHLGHSYCDRSRCVVHYTRINIIQYQRINAAVSIDIERIVLFLAREEEGTKCQNPYPT